MARTRDGGWSILALVVLAACSRSSSPVETATSPPVEASSCPAAAAPEGSPAARLDWMIGTWVSRDEAGTETTERWHAAADGTLIGESTTRDGEREVHSETLRVDLRDGQLVYVASPSTQTTTEFTGEAHCGSDALGNCSCTCEAAFRNPEHDFPQEITYGRCMQNDQLVATIRGGERSSSWTFRRTAEPTSPP